MKASIISQFYVNCAFKGALCGIFTEQQVYVHRVACLPISVTPLWTRWWFSALGYNEQSYKCKTSPSDQISIWGFYSKIFEFLTQINGSLSFFMTGLLYFCCQTKPQMLHKALLICEYICARVCVFWMCLSWIYLFMFVLGFAQLTQMTPPLIHLSHASSPFLLHSLSFSDHSYSVMS